MRKFYVCDLIKVISYQIHILNCRFNFPDLSNGATVPYNGKYRFEIWQRQINGSLKQPCILREFLLKSLFYFLVVHLSRQHYKACVRRGLGKQYICYIPCTSVAGGAASTTGGALATSQVQRI